MDNSTVINPQSQPNSNLEQLAEIEFPYPKNACKWVKIKIDWKRERWVKSQILAPIYVLGENN